ncbi:hypothetical protein M5K25_010952 [Dendrobium thyrsiflorum]|uniref:beta-N-acetylhexosaminidase n=1 Tax=Dendrobium thyrsiflorum TaxID=117978 RepID=A0ABD0V267_DENTH
MAVQTSVVIAQTVYGALHALETFSQLCYFNFTSKIIELHSAPWKIIDQPRFPYRGLLIDRESFPLEMSSYPNLWNGAYSYSERYTTADALEIVLYAQRRGINVLAEIDVPGHARSWGLGYPSLWPSFNCREPLDVSNEFTFQVLDGILSDFSKVFKFKFVHLGGDEVNTNLSIDRLRDLRAYERANSSLEGRRWLPTQPASSRHVKHAQHAKHGKSKQSRRNGDKEKRGKGNPRWV